MMEHDVVKAIRELCQTTEVAQYQRVLIFMQECGSIERLQALRLLVVVDLPKRISELTNEFGFKIAKERVDCVNQYGRASYYFRYLLEDSDGRIYKAA